MSFTNKGNFGYKDSVESKWGLPVLSEGFVPFPKRLLRCASQVFRGKNRMSQLSAFLAIVDYQRPQVTRKPTLRHLAGIAGLSEGRFRTALHSLGSRKLITWSGTEEGMEFNYDGLKKMVVNLTNKIDQK